MVVMPIYKCSRCERGKLPLDQMKLAGYALTSDGRYSASWCADCTREYNRERVRRERRDPEKRRRYNEATYRYRRKRQADPALRARDLENARMAARLRAERKGRPLADQKKVAPRLPTPEDKQPTVPTKPLLALLAKEAEGRHMTRDALAEACGIGDRAIRRWEDGEIAEAYFDTADKILTNLGLLPWQVFDDATCERLGYPVR